MSVDYAKLDLDRSQRAALRAERLTGASSDELDRAVDRIERAAEEETSSVRARALTERADTLRIVARRVEQAENGELDDDEPDGDTDSSSRRRSRSSSESQRLRRATRRATVGEPTASVAGSIEGAGSLFWRVVGWTIAIVLLYRVLTSSERAAGLLGELQRGVARVVYPQTAFPGRAQRLGQTMKGRR